ncbi:MAG: ATP-binding cassette domain-containing protein [Spirochaetales bacterium]|nr:ATP-binding cassette domain-containing protein [Spirochaetales bacterium]
MSETVIKAENLSKYYRLGQINNGMLFRDIQTWIARKLGKEDPHSQIGSVYDPNAEGFWALKDLNFEIKQGERVGIIGKNGAGKSTLLKILSQITAPTEGSLKIRGRIASLLEVGTGFHQEMTGRENIYLNGAILGMKKKEIDKKIDEIIAFSEIEQHIDTPVKRYSSGMYVRLAFAIAAHLDSDILIADEVLAVGDAAFQKKAIGKMNDLSAGEGRTVLFVSHQMGAVKQLCNRGIVLEKGRIVADGDISDCISFYQRNQIKQSTNYNLSDYNNEFFDLKEFSLLDDKGEVINEPHPNNEKTYVKIVIDVKQLHSALCMGYGIYTKDGEPLFWSYTSDDYENFKEYKKGINILIGEIPTHFLNEDTYYVYFLSSLHCIAWITNPYNDSCPKLKFEIQGGLSDSPLWNQKRPGICAPLLTWKVEQASV